MTIFEQAHIDKRVEQIGTIFFDRTRRKIFVVAYRVEIFDIDAHVIAEFAVAVQPPTLQQELIVAPFEQQTANIILVMKTRAILAADIKHAAVPEAQPLQVFAEVPIAIARIAEVTEIVVVEHALIGGGDTLLQLGELFRRAGFWFVRSFRLVGQRFACRSTASSGAACASSE